jgi:hypothetical protein
MDGRRHDATVDFDPIRDHDTPRHRGGEDTSRHFSVPQCLGVPGSVRGSAFPRLAQAVIAGIMFALVVATARPSAQAPGAAAPTRIEQALAPALQQGGRGGRGAAGPPPAGRAGAPVDLVGTWVSVVTEDWEWRMVTPQPGDVTSVPVTPLGRKAAASWTPAQDGRCEAYGVGGLMRMPGRLRISWQDDFTLKIESDQGQQTRLLNFAKPGAPIMSAPAGTARTLQGYSVAEWQRAGGAQDAFLERAVGAAGGTQRWGSLKVTTTNVAPGWLRRNGVPYGENAVITEQFIRFTHPEAGDWFVVTTIVEDPQYLTQPFITSSNFKKEPNDSKWSPVPCKTS